MAKTSEFIKKIIKNNLLRAIPLAADRPGYNFILSKK